MTARGTGGVYCPPFTSMIDLFPKELQEGGFAIKHNVLDEEFVKHEKLMSSINFSGYLETCDLEPGIYVTLHKSYSKNDGDDRCALVMSDTPMERRTNRAFVDVAKGDVLIAGLGIGMVLPPLLNKDSVQSVTVVELEGDIIKMVEPAFRPLAKKSGKTLTIVEASIFDWTLPKGAMWDTIYFDIWSDICGDNWSEMKTLNRKFSRRLNDGGWKGAWRKADMRYLDTGVWRDD